MKTNILILGLFLNISLFAFNNKSTGVIKFTITDKYLKDHSFITLLIKNTSDTNYYLPIINSSESEKWQFITSSNDKIFFFLGINCSNMLSKEYLWHSIVDTNEDKEEDLLFKLWDKKKKSIDERDFILLKSGESTIIKVPVNLIVTISKLSFWELKEYDKRSESKVAIKYLKKEAGLEEELLSKKTVCKLRRMGYKLYTDEIISNDAILVPSELTKMNDSEQNQNNIDPVKNEFKARLKKHVDIPKSSIQWKYYIYCSPNLKHIVDAYKYSLLKVVELCSIKECFLHMFSPDINEIIYRRLIEIARANFKNKIYLYLVAGSGSVDFAEKQNENMTDDNQLIYISVDDYVNSNEILKGVELYNSETSKLMKKLPTK